MRGKKRSRKSTCHKQGKRRFKTRINAAREAKRTDRIYYCRQCGGFHITTTDVGVAASPRR